MINPQQIKELTGISDISLITTITNNINDTLVKFKIDNNLRIQHFITQILHESGNCTILKENLNYSVKGLLTTFKKYFLNEAAAIPYARQPDKIANHVYANRMGNGSEISGDGAKFKGRGYIQLTGKNNYTDLSKVLVVDLIAHPELLEQHKYAALSAGWFWDKNNLNELADKDDIISITKKINGGLNGIENRKAILKKVKTIII